MEPFVTLGRRLGDGQRRARAAEGFRRENRTRTYRTRLESEISKIKDELSRLEQRLNDRERIMRVARNHCCKNAETCPNFEALDISKL